MYTTPQQRSAMQRDKVLPAVRSTRSAQAWSTLAAFLQPDGSVSCGWDRLLFLFITRGLTGDGDQEIALSWFPRPDGGSDLLLLYPDGSALVARTSADHGTLSRLLGSDRASWNDTGLLAGHTAVFSPIVLRASRLDRLIRVGKRLRFPAISLGDLAPMRLQEAVARAVGDVERVGPVFAPWHAEPGQVAAPWATLGHHLRHAPAPEGAGLCIQGLLLDHGVDAATAQRFQVLGITLDDQGQPVLQGGRLRLVVNTAGTYGAIPPNVVQAFDAWFPRAWNHPRAPWDARRWFAAERDPHSKQGQSKARRVPAVVLSGDVAPTSAHARCAAIAAYRESLAW